MNSPSFRTLRDDVEAWARRRPDATAVRCGEEALSYGELDSRASALAGALVEAGVMPEEIVGICLDRSVDFVVAMLAVLKAGGAYLPVDAGSPPARIRLILEDAGARVVITRTSNSEPLARGSQITLCVDSFDRKNLRSGAAASCRTGPDHLAYVIYTSGSTGKPKGVLVTHGNLIHLFRSTERLFGFGPQDVFTVFHSFAFDFSVWELWGALAYGGTAVIVPGDTVQSPPAFHEFLERHGVTVLSQTPSAFYPLIDADLSRPPGALTRLRVVCFGGEALDFRRLAPWFERHGRRVRLVNLYGITETTVHATWHDIHPGECGPDSVIGEPLPGSRIHLLDEQGKPVAPGGVGEIHVAGPGVARGYLRKPDLTAARFIADPFSSDPQARLYKSGDQARLGADGRLVFCGRLDDQVKLRGYRIELGEIEDALARVAGVTRCKAVLRSSPSRDDELVAYYSSTPNGSSPAALRDALARELPGYMVPTAFVRMEHWPLSHHGKLDHEALPPPRRADRVDGEIVAPRTSTEARVAAAWARQLQVPEFGIHDDCFALGGHSLMAARVCAELRQDLGAAVTIGDMLSARTVAELAARIDAMPCSRSGNVAAGLRQIARTARSERLPTTFQQDSVLFLHELAPDSLAYNNQLVIRLRGELRPGALGDALGAIVSRHEALRTTFERDDAGWTQVIHPPWPVDLPIVEDSPGLVDSLFRHRFDPGRLPLVRWTLVRVAPDEHLLVHVEHHTVHDGWSAGVFVRELISLYGTTVRNAPASLPALPVQYADYAAWQRTQLAADAVDSLVARWRARLAGAPAVLGLPTDRSRPSIQTFLGAEIQRDVSPALAHRLRRFAEARGFSLFSVMLAAFAALLRERSSQEDLVIGSGYANREHREIEGLIGMFVNLLPLRVDLSGQPSFTTLAARVQAIAQEALAGQALPFDLLVRSLDLPRDPRRNPLCQVAFSFHDSDMPAIELPGLVGEITYPHNGAAKLDMNVIVIPRPGPCFRGREWIRDDRITVKWDYNIDLFDSGTVGAMFDRYLEILEAALDDPGMRLAPLPGCGVPEGMARTHPATASTDAPDAGVPALFSAQVSERGAMPALLGAEGTISYAELDRRANRLAHHLRGLGAARGTPVAILLPRSADAVIAILAVLKAGAVYVPLDAAYPGERLAFMLADTRAPILVTVSALRDRVPEFAGQCVMLDGDRSRIEARPDGSPGEGPGRGDLAYIMYTSGSTGTPKGVCIEHRSIVRLVKGADYARFGPDDVFLQLAPISFDASTLEIWGSLLNGGRLAIFEPQIVSFDAVAEALRHYRVTLLWLTATLFHGMVDFEREALAGVRQVLAGGEALSVPHVRRMLDAMPPGHRLINGYGPTENTTFTCCHVMTRDTAIANSVPIGRPIHRTWVRILDEHRQPVVGDAPGELYIGGDGLARGYLDRPELTQETFVEVGGERLYRSGDRVRMLPDGTIEFLGRFDEQIKLRGYRIEPGEIEAALASHPAVRANTVAKRSDGSGSDFLVAFVVFAEGKTVAPGELTAFLAQTLPSYMVPHRYVVLDALPVTAVGKVDRQALAAMALPEDAASSFDAGSAVLASGANTRSGAGSTGSPAHHDAATRSLAGVALPRPDAESGVGGLTERALARLWSKHLRHDDFGADDDFFRIGGHSLAAAAIFAEIRRQFGVALPLSMLYSAPTIRALAAAVQDGVDSAGMKNVVPVQPLGRRAPVFAMLGVGGSLVACVTLSRALGEDRPFYSLEMPGLEDGTLPPERIELVAEALRRNIEAVRPGEPCVLVGACAGALVALELARRLGTGGRTVETVVLIDPPPTGTRRKRRLASSRLWRRLVVPRLVVNRLVTHARTLIHADGRSRIDFLKERLGVVREIITRRDLLRESRLEAQHTRVMEAASAALRSHQPKPYDGKTALLLGSRYTLHGDHSDAAVWRRLCRALVVVRQIPGEDTGSMFRPPHVDETVTALRQILDGD